MRAQPENRLSWLGELPVQQAKQVGGARGLAGSLTIVNVPHDQVNGIIQWRHLPTTVAVDDNFDSIDHTLLGAPDLRREVEHDNVYYVCSMLSEV